MCVCVYIYIFVYLFGCGCSLWLPYSSLRPTPGSLRTSGKTKGTIPDNMGEFEHEDDARGYKTREANHAELKVRDVIHKRLNPMPSMQSRFFKMQMCSLQGRTFECCMLLKSC